MKFKELFEMPEYINKQLPSPNSIMDAISVDSLDRDYDLIGHHKDGDLVIVSAMKKSQTSALIGHMADRDDGKKCLRVVALVDFHAGPSLGELDGSGPILQVDTVEAIDSMKGFGYGYALYKDILNAGYTVVSDNVQYIGGKALWQKIVRRYVLDKHKVFILQGGKLLRGEDGNVMTYDGHNIPDDVIWGKPGSVQHHHTLLVARNNK